jgi:hypothetical protein
MSGTSNFAIRLSVAGARETGDALKGVPDKAAQGVKGFGDASARAGGQVRGLRADTAGATPALRTLDSAAKGVGDAFTGIANRIPVIGPGLAAMGPAGLAAAAGIAAIGGAFFAMNGMAQKSREYLDDVATQAANMATSAETYQTLTALAIEQDIEFTKLAEAMNKLQLGAAMAAKGQGELFSTLKRVKPELVDVLVQAETQEDRWDALSRAISGTESQLDKVAIAKAAFGEKGAQFIRMLEGEDKTIGELTQRYKEMGLVIDEGIVAAAAAADTRLDLLNKRMEIDGVRAGAAMLSVIEPIATAWNNAQIALGTYLDSLNSVPDQQLSTLHERRKQLDEERKKLEADLNRGRYMGVEKFFYGELAEVKRTIASLDVEILRRGRQEPNKGAVSEGTVVTDPAAEAAAAAEANKAAAEAARKRADAERELAKALAEQQAVQDRVNAIIDSAKTPLQQATDAVALLDHQYMQGLVTIDSYIAAREILTARQKEAADAEAALAAEMNKSKKTIDDNTDALKRSTVAHEEAQAASFELRFASETIGGIFDQNIETLEDLGEVAVRVFRNMAIEAILAQSKIGGSGLMDFIGAGVGALFGGFGAPAAGGAGGLGGFKNGGGLSGGGFKNAGVHHLGGIVGMPAQVRIASADVFANAPRNHRGYPLAADERAVIAQVGEPIVAKWDARRIMEAVERGDGSSGGGVHIEIINQSGGKVEQQRSRGADGKENIRIFIREAVGGMIAGGEFDAPMASRYGAGVAVR